MKYVLFSPPEHLLSFIFTFFFSCLPLSCSHLFSLSLSSCLILSALLLISFLFLLSLPLNICSLFLFFPLLFSYNVHVSPLISSSSLRFLSSLLSSLLFLFLLSPSLSYSSLLFYIRCSITFCLLSF